MTPRRAAVALCCGAMLLAGCGGSGSKGKPIPAATADRLTALIERADAESSAGTCNGAQAKVREAQGVSIPSDVDRDVRQGIADGLDRLLSLVQSQCQPPQTQTTPTQTETTQTETTSSETTPSTTTPTTTTPSTTTPTTTTQTGTGTSTGTSTTQTSTSGNGGTPTGTGTGANGLVPGADAGNQG